MDFVDNNFRGEGLELEAVALSNFNANPAFLNNVSDPLVKAFSQTVHGFWTQLIRQTNQTALCPEGTESGSCESSLIPLNHTFVVPGGRFREQCGSLPVWQEYVSMLTFRLIDYWDSYWIVQGLIQSELYDIVKDTLENFMDELENFGFIPNGGRIYCECSMVVAFFRTAHMLVDLNRSQPPLFIHVRRIYVLCRAWLNHT